MKSRPAFRNDNAEPAAHCGLRVVLKSKKRQERTAIMEHRQYIVTMAVENVGARCEEVDGKAPEKTSALPKLRHFRGVCGPRTSVVECGCPFCRFGFQPAPQKATKETKWREGKQDFYRRQPR